MLRSNKEIKIRIDAEEETKVTATKNKILFLFLVPLLSSLCCCIRSGNTCYSYFHDVNSSRWNPIEVFHFQPSPTDSALLGTDFDVVVTLRHNESCNVSTLPLKVTQLKNGIEVKTDTISLQLSDAKGRWLSKGRLGIHSLDFTLARNLKIDYDYQILIKPAFENSDVKGINSVGVSLISHKQ